MKSLQQFFKKKKESSEHKAEEIPSNKVEEKISPNLDDKKAEKKIEIPSPDYSQHDPFLTPAQIYRTFLNDFSKDGLIPENNLIDLCTMGVLESAKTIQLKLIRQLCQVFDEEGFHRSKKPVDEVDVSANALNQDYQHIVSFIKMNTCVTKLRMFNCSLTEEAGIAIYEALQKNTKLTAMDLRNNKLSTEIIDKINQRLAENKSLKSSPRP